MRTWTRHVRHGIASLFTLILISSPVVAYGQTVTAMWDPSPPSDQVTSYQACIGTTSKSCNVQLASVSNAQTAYTFTPTPGVVHYVAIKATNLVGDGFVFNRGLVLDSVVYTAGQSKQPGRRRHHAAQHVGHRPRRECPQLHPHRVAYRPGAQCDDGSDYRHSVCRGHLQRNRLRERLARHCVSFVRLDNHGGRC